MNCKEIFGIQFRKARKELGLSQEEVAVNLGVARSVLSNWENGNTSPLLERLDEISQVLRKPIGYFFEASGDSEQFGITDRELAEVLIRTARSFASIRIQLQNLLGSMFAASTALEALAISEALPFQNLREQFELSASARDLDAFPKDFKGDLRILDQKLKRKAAEMFDKIDDFLPSQFTQGDIVTDRRAKSLFIEKLGIHLGPEPFEPTEEQLEEIRENE